MKDMTRENLKAALAGESQANIKYLAFAAEAAKAGKPNIARLFEAIAYAEQVHATNHLRELGGIGDTASNLQAAQSRFRFASARAWRAFCRAASSSSGMLPPVLKYISSGVCPRNAECGNRLLCCSTQKATSLRMVATVSSEFKNNH